MERRAEGENGLQMLSRSEDEGGNEGLEEKRQISSCWMKGLLSSLVGHIRDMLSFTLWRGKWFPPNSASIYLWLARPTRCTHTSSRVHICTAHARTCTFCTHTGFALIPDCFGFCGGLIRLLFKLCAKPVCVCLSEPLCVCVEVWWWSLSQWWE